MHNDENVSEPSCYRYSGVEPLPDPDPCPSQIGINNVTWTLCFEKQALNVLENASILKQRKGRNIIVSYFIE